MLLYKVNVIFSLCCHAILRNGVHCTHVRLGQSETLLSQCAPCGLSVPHYYYNNNTLGHFQFILFIPDASIFDNVFSRVLQLTLVILSL